MGYRSDVLIKVPEHRWEQYKDLVESKYEGALDDDVDISHHGATRYCVNEVHLFFSSVRWYPNFEDVNAIMSSLEELHDKFGMSYSYMRIGEEIGDIEDMHEDGDNDDKGKDVDYCYANYSIE